MATLLLFAAAREAAGCREAEIEGATAGEVLKVAAERFGPGFARILDHCSLVVDGETVPRERAWDTPVAREVAVLPPVSGGAEPDPPTVGAPAAGGEPGAHIRMVDVADKAETKREAVAGCVLRAEPAVRDRILAAQLPKGDAIASAKVAGTFAAKRVPELIPMCHPVRTTFVEVTCEPEGADGIAVRATVRGTDRTGFEIEALTAASVAALTIYDMAKSEDPAMRIEGLRLLSKSGGKSGEWRAP